MKIVICGNYGATNLGDEAILEGILSLIRRAIASPEITVLSANPEETSTIHKVESLPLIPAGPRSLMRGIIHGTLKKTLTTLKNADLFILGGGGLFTDEKLHAVFIWALQTRVAAWYKTPIFSFGQSVGPLKSFLGRYITRNAFRRAQIITVRDSSSAAIIRRFGIDDVKVLADPAFALRSPDPKPELVEAYIVLSVRPWIHGDTPTLYRTLALFIDWLWVKYSLKTLLVPFQVSHDNDVAELSSLLGFVQNSDAVELFNYTADYKKVMELMARSTAVIGMRLHSLIFSSLTHIPFIGLSYSEKVRQFAQQIQMEDQILDWSSLDLETLKNRFSSLLEQHKELAETLDQQVLLQRSKALQHEDLLRSLSVDI